MRFHFSHPFLYSYIEKSTYERKGDEIVTGARYD